MILVFLMKLQHFCTNTNNAYINNITTTVFYFLKYTMQRARHSCEVAQVSCLCSDSGRNRAFSTHKKAALQSVNTCFSDKLWRELCCTPLAPPLHQAPLHPPLKEETPSYSLLHTSKGGMEGEGEAVCPPSPSSPGTQAALESQCFRLHLSRGFGGGGLGFGGGPLHGRTRHWGRRARRNSCTHRV